jgi:hypothetical protein
LKILKYIYILNNNKIMNRIVKIQSIQSGNFNKSKNLVDFDIMDNAQHNLKNSYVNLRGSIRTTDATPRAFGPAVYNYNFAWSTSAGTANIYYMPNEAIVKNARLTCDSQSAPLEDIRRSDVLRTQLSKFTNGDDDIYGKSYKDINQVRTQGDLKVGLNLDLVREGTRMSKYNELSVQIPLNKFLELGNMENFPTPKLGKTRLHLELNLDDKLSFVQYQAAGAQGSGEFGNVDYLKFNDVNVTGAVTKLIVTQPFTDLKYSPYWVGQLLSFTATGAGGATNVAATQRIITEISYINDVITITLDESIKTLAVGESLTVVAATGVDWASGYHDWTQCELVLEENGNTVEMDQLEYATYKNEEDNGNGLKKFSRQYNVEPECFNLFVCLPDATLGDLWSVGTNIAQYQTYRIRSDNVDLTDRDVAMFSPLYNDRIAMTLLNANLPLKSLNPHILNTFGGHDARLTNTENSIFIGNPLPSTLTNKLVQISITGDAAQAGVNSIQLYKQVFKSIKL